jgi:serine/threonine protein phosphatase 1
MVWKFWRRAAPARRAGEFGLEARQRVYAIADIHGRADCLDALLRQIGAHAAGEPDSDVTLVFLGDYVDRGPDSRTVVERLAAGSLLADRAARAVFLMGNHEEMLLRFLDDPSVGTEWRQYGGLATLASYGIDLRDIRLGRGLAAASDALAKAMPAGHRAFFEGLAPAFAQGGYFFCHAGVRPGIPLSRQSAADLRWVRDEFLASTEDFGAMIVHGHTPVEEPDRRHNRMNLDLGAYATGRLACAALRGERVDFLIAEAAG